jgi:hypothetical protein
MGNARARTHTQQTHANGITSIVVNMNTPILTHPPTQQLVQRSADGCACKGTKILTQMQPFIAGSVQDFQAWEIALEL